MTARDRRMWAVVVLGPLLVGAAGVLAVASWRHDLPATVATHWGSGAGPNGFSARATGIALVGLGAPIGLLMGVLIGLVGRRFDPMRAMAGGLAVGLAAFVTVLAAGSLWTQRGLTDPRLAPDPTMGLVLGVAAALVLGVAAGALVPRLEPGAARATRPVPAGAPRAALGPDETAAWSQTMAPGPLVALLGGLAIGPLLVLCLAGVLRPAVGAVVAPALLLLVATTCFRVVVGRRGLVVRSFLGWPSVSVPLDDVAEAEVTHITPLRDFGGWGLRASRGRVGVVIRRGAALDVTRGDGSHVVVTVDGAHEGAALLNSLAERQRSIPSP